MAPQPLEKIESGPGNGMVSKASNLDAFRSAGAPREQPEPPGNGAATD
jgi:hypothetical protein